jgi:hypothetical protein
VANINKLLRKMLNNLNDEKRNIDQFYLSSKITVTELYKSEAYIVQLRAIINKLECLIKTHDKLTIDAPLLTKKTKQYALLINDIVTEVAYLKATNDSMQDNLNQITKSEFIQYRISGNVKALRKQMNKMVKKADSILSPKA